MYTMKNDNRGFTIIELLIAMVLASMVLTGVYKTFDALINTKEATEESYYRNNLLLSAKKIVKPDVLQLYKNTMSVSHGSENDTLTLTTNNSIKMEKAFPVQVTYYIDDDDYLIREEKSPQLGYEWKLPLLKNVTEFKVLSHNGNEFTKSYSTTDTIIKVSFKVKDYGVEFIAGCGHLSHTADYQGAEWN